jgi:ubiquinone/menaquinone biosynthesis C-methylase UbiE
MEINLLKGLPYKKKPLQKRLQASQEDKILSWKIDKEYFDGTRAQGYGGYKYDGRWSVVADNFIKHYNLDSKSRILEIGCAKGFLLKEFKNKIKNYELFGLDISSYAVSKSHKSVQNQIIIGNAIELPFEDRSFDLIICINTLHNILEYKSVRLAIKEMVRVSAKNIYISVGAFRNQTEKNNLDKWAVLSTTYMHTSEWLKLFRAAKYKGDYQWFIPKV